MGSVGVFHVEKINQLQISCRIPWIAPTSQRAQHDFGISLKYFDRGSLYPSGERPSLSVTTNTYQRLKRSSHHKNQAFCGRMLVRVAVLPCPVVKPDTDHAQMDASGMSTNVTNAAPVQIF